MISPYVLPRWLIAHAYLDFLTNNLANVLKEVLLATRRDCGISMMGRLLITEERCEIGLTKTFLKNGSEEMDRFCGLPDHLILTPVIAFYGVR